MEDPGSQYSAILSYVKLACFLLYNFTIKECSFLVLSCRLLWFVYSKQVLLLAAYIYSLLDYNHRGIFEFTSIASNVK